MKTHTMLNIICIKLCDVRNHMMITIALKLSSMYSVYSLAQNNIPVFIVNQDVAPLFFDTPESEIIYHPVK